jgi:hypothetical protein
MATCRLAVYLLETGSIKGSSTLETTEYHECAKSRRTGAISTLALPSRKYDVCPGRKRRSA